MKQNKKNYICITPFFPSPEAVYGSYCYDQVMSIKKGGRYKDVVVMKPCQIGTKERMYQYKGIKVYLFPQLSMPSALYDNILDRYNVKLFMKTWSSLPVSREKATIVHAHTALCAKHALALKDVQPELRVLLQHHDLDPFGIRLGRFHYLKSNVRLRARQNMKYFDQVDLHVCISKAVERQLLNFPQSTTFSHYAPYEQAIQYVKDFHSHQNWKSYVLYNGVDTTVFYANPQKHDHFVIGCIGNYNDVKDQITLIKALEILVKEKGLQDIRLRFIGHGPMKSVYESYAIEHGLSEYITFEKEVDHSLLPSFYNSIDLFCLPSYFEGFGCVFTEAHSCGVPFMACKGQGASEYVYPEDEHKWLFEPHDAVSLAKLIEQYRQKPVPQRVQYEYDIQNLVDQFTEMLELSH